VNYPIKGFRTIHKNDPSRKAPYHRQQEIYVWFLGVMWMRNEFYQNLNYVQKSAFYSRDMNKSDLDWFISDWFW